MDQALSGDTVQITDALPPQNASMFWRHILMNAVTKVKDMPSP